MKGASWKADTDRYLEFLRTGSSRTPLDSLRRASVDMTTPQPMLAVSSRMNELIDRFEVLVADVAR